MKKYPSKTYTKERILKLLKGYIRADISDIPVGTHIRYFIPKRNPETNEYVFGQDGIPKRLFRTGGFVESLKLQGPSTISTPSRETFETGTVYMRNEPIGKAGAIRWQIKLGPYIEFFRKPTLKMYRDKMRDVIKQKDDEIKRLRNELFLLRTNNEMLTRRLKNRNK